MIDPEFWSDEKIGRWSFAARLFYIGLWNYADDEGRFKANDMLLKAQIFPYNPKISLKKLKQELDNKVLWYESEDGLQYGLIRNFLKYQRIDKPTPSKLPDPPLCVPDISTNAQGGLPPNIKEVNRREVKLSIFVEGEAPYDLAIKFFEEIRKNKPDHKKPNFQVWAKEFDLMIRVDKRDPAKIEGVFIWCQQDDFEKTNVLSPKKLRARFDQLEMKSKTKKKKYGIIG